MQLVVFFDNDAILKLVACSLFSEAISSLGVSEANLRVLESAEYVFRKNKKVGKTHPLENIEKATSIVKRCRKIQVFAPTQALEEILLKEREQLQAIEGIDPGEQTLILATRFEESFYVSTGDKRWTTALINAPQLVEIKKRLMGRVICFEQLILKLIDTQGFEEVLTKVLPATYCDTALKAAFGSREKCTQENVKLALQAYIEDLRKNTNGLLADF